MENINIIIIMFIIISIFITFILFGIYLHIRKIHDEYYIIESKLKEIDKINSNIIIYNNKINYIYANYLNKNDAYLNKDKINIITKN